MRNKLQQAGLVLFGLIAGIFISLNFSAIAQKEAAAPHNNWKWFGGPGCNCTHIDNSNVLLVNATDLDPAYALLSLSKGT